MNGEAIATVDGVPNGLYVRSPDTRLLWRKSFGPGEYVLSFRSTGWGINFYGLWLSGPLQLPSETPGWLGFANGIVEQDRDAELRLHCGNFKRVEVPYSTGNNFRNLCGYVNKSCEKVCDWQGQMLSCDSVSLGGRRDGTRVALCQ